MPRPSPAVPRSSLGLLAALVVAVGFAAGATAQSQEPKPKVTPPAASPSVATPSATPASGVSGNAYTSPTFGYSLSWDPAVWSVEDEAVSDGYNGLQLGTPRSTVYVEGITDFGGDPVACLADARSSIEKRQGVSNLTTVSNRDRPLPAKPGEVAQLFGYTQQLQGGQTAPVLEYVDCRTIVPGQAVLEITWQTAAPFYDQELPLVHALLGSLGQGGPAAPAGTPEIRPRATPVVV